MKLACLTLLLGTMSVLADKIPVNHCKYVFYHICDFYIFLLIIIGVSGKLPYYTEIRDERCNRNSCKLNTGDTIRTDFLVSIPYEHSRVVPKGMYKLLNQTKEFDLPQYPTTTKVGDMQYILPFNWTIDPITPVATANYTIEMRLWVDNVLSYCVSFETEITRKPIS